MALHDPMLRALYDLKVDPFVVSLLHLTSLCPDFCAM